MIDILRAHNFDFVHMYNPKLAHQVKSVLAKIELCRTKALGGHVYRCPGCELEVPMYNSCRDRHCPQCSGGQRGQWLERTEQLLRADLPYFQAVFTLPKQVAAFSMGNRAKIFGLLMRSSWQALDELLREQLGVQPAASLMLHTWNQHLEIHPHVHALVPGGFPSLDGQRWVTPKHPKHRRRRKAYLCDVVELGRRFRQKFLEGLEKLFARGELKFQHAWQAERPAFEAWLEELRQCDWNVYIQGPPSDQSKPVEVAKYLARYMTGGPISDGRIIAHEDGQVWFWARSRTGKTKRQKKQRHPVRLSGRQFVHRWSQHILPKGFTKARGYGGFHNTKRSAYLEQCRQLLGSEAAAEEVSNSAGDDSQQSELRCPRCDQPMFVYRRIARPSWREVLAGEDAPDWYGGFINCRPQHVQWDRDGY